MANVGRPPPAPPAAAPVAAIGCRTASAIAAFRQLEAQRPGDRIGLRETKRQALADAVGLARFVADQLLRRFVVAEIFPPEILREHQPIAAQILDRSEEAERLNPADP